MGKETQVHFRIIREATAEHLEEMIPLLIFRDECERVPFVKEVVRLLIERPEILLVLQVRESETDELLGFIVANNPTGVGYVWVAQAWSKSTNGREVADEMLKRVLIWAAALGKLEIRAETSRDGPSFLRRFGFDELYKVISRRIDPEILNQISQALGASHG